MNTTFYDKFSESMHAQFCIQTAAQDDLFCPICHEWCERPDNECCKKCKDYIDWVQREWELSVEPEINCDRWLDEDFGADSYDDDYEDWHDECDSWELDYAEGSEADRERAARDWEEFCELMHERDDEWPEFFTTE